MSWQDTLKALAPTVLSAALGPAGAGIVAAVGAIIGIAEPTQEKIAQAFQSGQLTPEQISDIKKLELQLQADEKERGFRYAELEFKDRDSARNMQIATKSWVPSALAMTITLGYLGILIGLMLDVLHVADNQVLLILIGALATGFGTVLNFFLGSSHGSSEKTALLAKADAVK